jgi:hypothetical protein
MASVLVEGMFMENQWDDPEKENKRYRLETCPTNTLHPTWII